MFNLCLCLFNYSIKCNSFCLFHTLTNLVSPGELPPVKECPVCRSNHGRICVWDCRRQQHRDWLWRWQSDCERHQDGPEEGHCSDQWRHPPDRPDADPRLRYKHILRLFKLFGVFLLMGHRHIFFVFFMSAKEVKSLLETSQSTFSSKLSELGLAESLGPKTEYTLLAPFNSAFTSELKHVLIYRKVALFLWL